MRLGSLALTLLLANLTYSQSMEETFKLINYTPPAGWTTTGTDQAPQYMHSQANAFCIITMYTSAYSAGSEFADFQEEWNMRVLSVGAALEVFNPSAGSLPSGINFIQGGADITLNNGAGNMYAHLLVIRIDNMRQSILLGMANKSMLTHYQKEFDLFLTSIKEAHNATNDTQESTVVTPDKDIPVVASNKGTFYYGVETIFIGPGAGNNPKFLYLFPDRSFQWGYFQRGYYNYNKFQEQKSSPDFCGTYTQTGNIIKLNFANNATYKPEFSIDEKGNLKERSGGYTLFKYPSINSVSLQGTYSVENPDLWGGNKPQATFFADGRFDDNGLLCLGQMVDNSMPPEQAGEQMRLNKIPGKGNYKIIDHSLILSYDDGRRRQLLICIPGKDKGKSSPEIITVSNLAFVLIKR